MATQKNSTIQFNPNPLVRSASAQTMLAMLRPRHLDITLDERPMLLDAGEDLTGMNEGSPVRMIGYFNASRTQGVKRGLVMILHGWEGCSHSNFNLIMAQTMVEQGYDVFRLNLRDHGPQIHVDSYTLNRGLFLGTLIEEAAAATRQVVALAGGRPVYILGASMGGNFALRLARWHSEREEFPNLRKVIAVCPAINPGRATDSLDRHRGTRLYFRRRWLRSLRAKQQSFPTLYNFTELEEIPLVRDMTAWLIDRYGHVLTGRYANTDQYFAEYSVVGDALSHLTVPTTILTSRNDPVVPVIDFYALAPHPLLHLHILPTGGHCGFMDAPPVRHHLPAMMIQELTSTLTIDD